MRFVFEGPVASTVEDWLVLVVASLAFAKPFVVLVVLVESLLALPLVVELDVVSVTVWDVLLEFASLVDDGLEGVDVDDAAVASLSLLLLLPASVAR